MVERRDSDLLREAHRFVRTGGVEEHTDECANALAYGYEAHLHRDYGIVDLSKAKKGLVGMRWRTREEWKTGKGTRVCGSIGCCAGKDLLSRIETLFAYVEAEERREAKVKLWLCGGCLASFRRAREKKKQREVRAAEKANLKREREEERRERKNRKKERREEMRAHRKEKKESLKQTGKRKRHTEARGEADDGSERKRGSSESMSKRKRSAE